MSMAASSSSSRSGPPTLVTTARSTLPGACRLLTAARRALPRTIEAEREAERPPLCSTSAPRAHCLATFQSTPQRLLSPLPVEKVEVAAWLIEGGVGEGRGVWSSLFVLCLVLLLSFCARSSRFFSSRDPWAFSISSDLRSRTKPVGLWAILLLLQPNHFQPNHLKKVLFFFFNQATEASLRNAFRRKVT